MVLLDEKSPDFALHCYELQFSVKVCQPNSFHMHLFLLHLDLLFLLKQNLNFEGIIRDLEYIIES